MVNFMLVADCKQTLGQKKRVLFDNSFVRIFLCMCVGDAPLRLAVSVVPSLDGVPA